MTVLEAAKILDLPPDATPEQLEARFLELRAKLEDKIVKAPTPGLKAKYRESLNEITAAFETLALAADSSALPVLQKQGPKRAEPGTGAAAPSTPLAGSAAAPAPARATAKRKSGGKEFAIVALIAVVLLGIGGWFVMKTRADNAEKARIAAEAQAEQARAAEAARLAAEQKKQADEAERARLEKLAGQLRGELAEAKVLWEALEREERAADRRLAELKSDLRSLRDVPETRLAEARTGVAAQQEYFEWLSDTLARHPTKLARSKADELLGARQVAEARVLLAGLRTNLAELEAEVRTRRAAATNLEGQLELITDDRAVWTIEDAFGRARAGRGSGTIDQLGAGPARLSVKRPHWPDRTENVTIVRGRSKRFEVRYAGHNVTVASTPDGAEVRTPGGSVLGVTPLPLANFPAGKHEFTLHKDGYYVEPVTVTLPLPSEAPLAVTLRARPKGFAKPERWNAPAKVRLESRSTTQVFGGNGAQTNTHVIEEWDFSAADPQRGWSEALRRFVSLAGTNRNYMPAEGSVIRLRLQSDGAWKGEFIRGGLSDASLNPIWSNSPTSAWLVNFGTADVFPNEAVELGGTWDVKPDRFFALMGLTNFTGKVRGRLLALEREGTADWAEVEYSYTYTVDNIPGQATMKLRVNVAEGYVARLEMTDATTGDIRVQSNSTITVTKR